MGNEKKSKRSQRGGRGSSTTAFQLRLCEADAAEFKKLIAACRVEAEASGGSANASSVLRSLVLTAIAARNATMDAQKGK